MKIIHTSDWHIGRQFHNHSLLEDQQYVLHQIIDYVKSENADVLVIAGDIYDRSVPPAAAVAMLDDVLNTVCNKLNVSVVIIPGNHDSVDRLSFGARQLKKAGLYIMGDLLQVSEPVTLKGSSEVAVQFYGIPFNDPEQVRNLFDTKVNTHNEAHNYLVEQIEKKLDPNQINLLISHCFIDGAEESESERPLSIGGADRVSYEPMAGFNYVALGHLHSPQYRGQEHIRYSGSLLKYSFSEQKQKKSATLIEFDIDGIPKIAQLPLKPLRDMRIIEGEIATIIDQGKTDPNNEDYLMVRLTDTHAILNAMAQLRNVYPNVLHLEKPGIMAIGDKKTMNREQLKRSELEIFRDFYSQVSGNTLSEDQNSALEEVINSLQKSEANQ